MAATFRYPSASPRGSVALISLLLISVITVVIALSMSNFILSLNQQTANRESNEIGYYGAEACLEEGLIRLEQNQNFIGTTINLSNDVTCSIEITGSNPLLMSIEMNYLTTTQLFEADIQLSTAGTATNVDLVNWQEKP